MAKISTAAIIEQATPAAEPRSRTATASKASTNRLLKRPMGNSLISPPTEKRQARPTDERFNKLQQSIESMEAQCAQEQLAVERKWQAKMDNAYQERRQMIATIPGFWGDVLRASFPFVTKCDELVFPYITDLHVNTCLDELGSYQGNLSMIQYD